MNQPQRTPGGADSRDVLARYERFRALDPGNLELLAQLGDLYHQAGRFDEALACYEDGLHRRPGHAGLRGRIGGVHLSQHRFAEAEVTFRALLEATPQDAALQHNLGIALAQQARWAEAQQALDAAQQAGASDPGTFAYLAHAWHHLGKLDEALDAAQRWASAAPSAAAEGYLALLHMDRGNMDEAYRRAETVLATDPGNVHAGLVAGVSALESQDMDRAAELFGRAVQLEPDTGRGWIGVALTRLHRGEHARAAEAFERALVLNPGDVGTRVALGWTRMTGEDFASAEREFRRAIAVDRNFGEAHGGLASALVLQNRRDEARRELEIARGLDPQGFGMVYAQSILLALEGRREVGERLLERAFQRSVRPGSPTLIAYMRQFMQGRATGTQPPALPPPGARRPVRR